MNERRDNPKKRSDIVGTISTEIYDLKEALSRIELKTDFLTEKTNKLEKKIYGNGVAGVLSRVDIIETEMKDFKNNKKENRDIFWKLATFGLSIFSGFIAFYKR